MYACVCKRISLLLILGEKNESTDLVLVWVLMSRLVLVWPSVFPILSDSLLLSVTPESHIVPTADS